LTRISPLPLGEGKCEGLSPLQSEHPEPRQWQAPSPLWLEALIFGVILAAAAFFRFWRLDALPPGIDLDEARNGIEVLRVLAGSHPLFFTQFDPREPAFIYSLSLAVRALGHTVMAMRVTSALWSLAGVALTYPLARQWFGRRVALLATAGMAASLWSLGMSRWAERDVSLPPLLLLFLFFFWRGFARRSTASFALAGALASACAYAYVAARILPFLVALILLAQLILARETIVANVRGLLVGLATAAATISPLGVYFARHPEVFFGRISAINTLAQPLPGLSNDSVWQTALNTLGMFFVHGDVNWRDDVSGRPVFEWWLAGFFCLGVLWALWHLLTRAKDVRTALEVWPAGPGGAAVSGEPGITAAPLYPCLWLLLWQGALLVPAFLARPSPQFDRTIGALPSTYILLAVGLVASWGWLRSRDWGAAGLALVAGLMGLLAITTYRAYFQSYAQVDGPRHVFEYGQAADAAILDERQPPPDHTFLFLGRASGLSVRYLAPQYGSSVWMEDFSQLVPIPSSGPAIYVFAEPTLPGNGDMLSTLQRYFPQAAIDGKASFYNGDQAGRVYDVTAGQIQEFLGAARPIQAPFAGKVMLDTSSAGIATQPARPGDTVRLGLGWRMLAASSDNYGPFIHVVDAAGKVVAQADVQGQPTDGWRADQRFLSLHEFRLPDDARPGRYRVLAGLDLRTSGSQPSQPLGELGPQVEVLTLDLVS
jgi:4-amino-4-deoxy-L-arabinose transferase-like glycosyltransferase